MIRDTGERQVWVYGGGIRVVLANGVVVESNASMQDVESGGPNIDEPRPSAATHAAPKNQERSRPARDVRADSTVQNREITKNLGDSSGYGVLVAGAGVVIVALSGIFILIEAFSASVLWGIAVLLFPIAQIVFVATHWNETKKPFLISLLIGFPLVLVGFHV